MKKTLIVCAVIAACASCSDDPAADTGNGTDGGTDAATSTGTDAGTDTGTGTVKDSGTTPTNVCTTASCSGHGACTATSTGITCACEAGYGGAKCTECAPGSQDKDGNKTCAPACTATMCGSHGTCNDSSGTAACTCDAGYSGASCGACATGYQDNNNDKICALSCAPAGACSSHGTCVDTTGTAVCTCATGYTGPACAACAAGYQDNDNDKTCTLACAAGTCSSHGTCADATGTAVCTCAAEYAGAACASCAAGYQDNDNDKTCTAACGATTCTSAANGTCADATGTTVCTCLGHATGPACATCTGNFAGAACDTCVAGKGGPNCDYDLVYGLNLPTDSLAANGNNYTSAALVDAKYDVNNSAVAGAFTRVAYRLALGAEEVWVEMDAFTANKNQLGIPADWIFDQAVTNVTVVSKAVNQASIPVPAAGYIEFWSNCYGPAGGNSAIYDYKDTIQGTDCYGSLQVHVGTNTIFAFNRWASNATSTEAGFGNHPNGGPGGTHTYWTFSVNMASYATRRLEVFVK